MQLLQAIHSFRDRCAMPGYEAHAISMLTGSFFKVVGEIEDVVKTGLWVGDCFIYTNSGDCHFLCRAKLYQVRHTLSIYIHIFVVNRLNYYVGGEIVTIAHLDG